jgi:hypothetical protein
LETKARFIAQIMTGESGLRRAEDVGGQELSYAEVKAIASGNPAVLTLAEADAELQRLAVLRRNHADEQFLARRNLRELPQTIERLGGRLAALEADQKTITGGDAGVLIVNGRSVAPQDAALGNALNRIPEHVERLRRFPVGRYRGLEFGIERHPGGAADVYLEGETCRTAILSRESQGPRAVMNALGRLADSYEERVAGTKQDLAVATTQLGDYEARIGRAFRHAEYMDELTGLRDRLKVALSGTPAEGEPTTGDLAERINALKASHEVEAAPARARAAKPRAESVRRKPESEKPVEEAKPEEPKPAEEKPDAPPDDDSPPSVPFQQRVRKSVQMSLF